MKNKSSLKNSPYYDKIKYFITNFDILSVFPNSKIIKYADLDSYKDIYELMPSTTDFVFLLTESETNSGHWTLLLRSEDKFEYFDSYGESPQNILSFISPKMNKKLGNNYKEDLGKMLKSIKSNHKYSYNKFQFQSDGIDVNTCGRWCILRCALFLIDNMMKDDFTKLIKYKSKQLNLSFDELVSFLIPI